MKRKIICILVMTLMIGAGTIAVADWDPEDGHKMHWPQEPDPNGWDIDFGYSYQHLGDDWQCSECGSVDEIHFWVSWYYDNVYDIPSIYVSIWSNNPGTNYSYPDQMLWNRTFYPEDFIIKGPFNGTQGWYYPYFGWWEEDNHHEYYQINIMDIEDPFYQKMNETYWLVIKQPLYYYNQLGWKESESDQFMDAAVYGYPGIWYPIDDPITGEPIDLAFVINGEGGNNPPGPPVITGPTSGKPGTSYTYTFTSVDPDGHDVSYFIDWGDGTTSGWTPCQPSGTSYIEAHTWNTKGSYVIRAKARDCACGLESPWSSYKVEMPRDKVINRPLLQFLQSHPNMFPILQLLLQHLGL